MGERAGSAAATEFDIDVMVRRLEALYAGSEALDDRSVIREARAAPGSSRVGIRS